MSRLHILPLAVLLASALALASCSLDDDSSDSSDSRWARTNQQWLEEQLMLKNADGSYYYEQVIPAWNPSAMVLIHWFNDRKATEGNLVPLLTSTVQCKYLLQLCDGTRVDSSYTAVDSVFTTRVSGVIEGWQIALQTMHVGDSVRLIVPYSSGYGTTTTGTIPAYSNLMFDVKLKDVTHYETPN